jgi:hypothetical protein
MCSGSQPAWRIKQREHLRGVLPPQTWHEAAVRLDSGCVWRARGIIHERAVGRLDPIR